MENIMNNSTFRKMKLERNRKFANAKFKATEAFMFIYGGGAIRKAQTAFLNMARVKSFREKLPERSRKVFDGIFGTEKDASNVNSRQRMGAAGMLANMGVYITTCAGVRMFGTEVAADFGTLTGAINTGLDDIIRSGAQTAYADELPVASAEVTNDNIVTANENASVDMASPISENTSSYIATENEMNNSNDYSTVAAAGTVANDSVVSTEENTNVVAMPDANGVSVDVNGDGNEDAIVNSEEPVVKEEITDEEKKQLENGTVDDNVQTTTVVDESKYENADIAYTQDKDKDELGNLYKNLDDEAKGNFNIESNATVDAASDGSYTVSGEFDAQDKQIIIIDTDKGKIAIAMNEYFDGGKTPTTVNDNMLSVIVNNLIEQNSGMFDGKDITVIRTDLTNEDVCKVDLDGDGIYDIFISEKDGNTVIEGDCVKSVDNVIANNMAKENVPDTPDKDGKIPETPTEPVTTPTEPVTTPTEPVTTPTEPVTTPTEPETVPSTDTTPVGQTEPVVYGERLAKTGDEMLNVAAAAGAAAVASGIAAKVTYDKVKTATAEVPMGTSMDVNHDEIAKRAKYEVLMKAFQAESDDIYNSYFGTSYEENDNSLSNSSGRTR